MKALTRKEKILNGENIEPLTRPEIFTKKAVNEGGGGLPPYTDNDEGKALAVKKAAPVPVEMIIVPEQQVVVPRGGTADLSNVIYPFPELEEGQEATVTVTYETTDSWTLIYREIDGTKGFFNTEKNAFLIYYAYGAWKFDPGLEGNYTVSLKGNVPVQPMVPKVILPEVTLTLEAHTAFGIDYWGAGVPEDSGVDAAFFENAQVGDVATFVLDGETYESTAVNYLSNMVLFPIGLTGYVFGYAPVFGGIGLAAMEEPAEMTHTVSGTISVPKMEAAWVDKLYYFVPGETTPQNIIDAIDAGALVVFDRPDSYDGMGILVRQFSTGDAYKVVFIGATMGYQIAVYGDAFVAFSLTDPYEAGGE